MKRDNLFYAKTNFHPDSTDPYANCLLRCAPLYFR